MDKYIDRQTGREREADNRSTRKEETKWERHVVSNWWSQGKSTETKI